MLAFGYRRHLIATKRIELTETQSEKRNTPTIIEKQKLEEENANAHSNGSLRTVHFLMSGLFVFHMCACNCTLHSIGVAN